MVDLLGLALALSLVAGQGTTGVQGDWVGPTGSVVRVFACGSEVCLKVVRLPPNPPASVDLHNPDQTLRSRPLCGLDFGKGFRQVDADHLEGGSIYDPTSGKTYSGTITTTGDRLKLRGYVGVSLFGRSEVWKRVPDVKPCS